MIVFGDHDRSVNPADALAHLLDECHAVAAMPAGIERHGRLCGAFILAGEITQGIADSDMAALGHDEHTQAQRALTQIVMQLAASVAKSWECGFASDDFGVPDAGLDADKFPDAITLRQPEGYAFYALYPETYVLAARSLALSQARVIGVRSIGTSLSAIVACALDAPAPVTVRPVGHPFDRQLSLSAALAAQLADQPDIPRVVVDEGPGLSGSSFGAVTAWLAGAGVPEQNILCLPGHEGEPGAMARPDHKARYGRIRKATVPFERLYLWPEKPQHGLAAWFTDLVGPPLLPLQDLSGGAWRSARGLDDVPAIPMQERRKFLLRTQAGVFLLKFVGLGQIGAHKLQRAKCLAERGLVPEPIAVRHGFMIERWHEDAQPPASHGPAPIEAIGRYLATRATLFPAHQGADLATLAAMARHNTQEALGHAAAQALRFNTDLPLRAIHVDARLHRWEWLALPDGRLLKADALDHSTGHDLIGCQDVAWDIAGATVEFDLTGDEREHLRRIVARTAGIEIHPALVADCILYYCAFQLAHWSPLPPARYARRLCAEA
jgi:hypothetical protein